jgi:hypothetical protein
MGRNIRAGDQLPELGQHPGLSRSCDRYDSCRCVGRGGCERHAAHLRWVARRICQGDPDNWLPRRTCPHGPDKRRPPEKSCGRPGHGDRPRIRRREAVPHRHSALSLRVVPSPTAAVTPGIEIVIAVAFTLAQVIAITLAFAFAPANNVALTLVIPVSDGLRPIGLSLVAHRHQLAH